ncbi:MAG: Vi polysaccharide biosynthesis UDP-N-acetylglucosamine C-6 dehydrogenase TviB [Candidatus Pelagibacter sp.]|nr:Vi polysaccharide biosynthesis UDP-N-acetylglucosamine C-6 dehydrogenase TviB [Candidatus Pelagibacter sp.]
MINKIDELKLAVIGLGYVGLPLALAFEKKRSVIGFDIQKKRIEELLSGTDKNLESTNEELKNVRQLNFTSNEAELKSVNCYIITVPTPINEFKEPNLKPLFNASEIVGKFIKKGDLIIYESTVYPGCVEERCVPILEKFSKLNFNKDFFCGYSPERINPGDKNHTVSNIKKITSGSTKEIADLVDDLYNEIVTVGTHKAPSIKVAEAAKVIENTQRDLNIALINELSIFFNKMNIDTEAVLSAAESKWNFLPFKPGLVGGHCIGVDPYYLTYKAKSIGYDPKIILAGRELNDKMGDYVASQLIKEMKKKSIKISGAKILIMGLTFKENCADIRNSGVKNVIESLKNFNCNLDLYDPWVDKEDIKKTYDIHPKSSLNKNTYDGIIIAVAHDKFKTMGFNSIYDLCKKNNVIYDLKYLFTSNKIDLRL